MEAKGEGKRWERKIGSEEKRKDNEGLGIKIGK